MFFKTIETCTTDNSDRYVKGEKTELVFEADTLEEMEAYFTGITDYLTTHDLEVTIIAIGDDEVEAACEEFGCLVMDVKEFN